MPDSPRSVAAEMRDGATRWRDDWPKLSGWLIGLADRLDPPNPTQPEPQAVEHALADPRVEFVATTLCRQAREKAGVKPDDSAWKFWVDEASEIVAALDGYRSRTPEGT